MRSRPAFFCLFRFFAYFAFFRRRLPRTPRGARFFSYFALIAACSSRSTLFSCFALIAACSSRSTLFCLFCVDYRVLLAEHSFLLILRRLPRVPHGARFSAYFASFAACPLRSTPFLFHSPPLPFPSSFSAFLAFRIFKRLLVPLTIITSASKSATT